MFHNYTAQVMALGFDSTSIQTFLKNSIIPIIILFVGATLILLARKQEHRGAITVVGICFLGLFVIGLAAGSNATDLGAWMVQLFTGTGEQAGK